MLEKSPHVLPMARGGKFPHLPRDGAVDNDLFSTPERLFAAAGGAVGEEDYPRPPRPLPLDERQKMAPSARGVALDLAGNLAATSTGGMTNKLPDARRRQPCCGRRVLCQ